MSLSALDMVGLLDKLGPACRKHGVKRIVIEGVEIEFATSSADVDPAKVKAFQAMIEQGMPSDEEVMNWSAPGFVPGAGFTGQPAQAPLARQAKE